MKQLVGNLWWLLVISLVVSVRAEASALPSPGKMSLEASSVAAGSGAAGAVDGRRFATEPAATWRGKAGQRTWWWQVTFAEPRTIGAILQIHGDHATIFRNAPRRYVWQASLDGKSWHDLKETAIERERRLFRTHRLTRPQRWRYLRLQILEAEGDFPTLREVEFFADPKANIPFPPWAVVVSTTGDDRLPGAGGDFIPLAKSCKGFEPLQAQQVWLGDFNESFVAAEPRPLCAFLSGNFIDWCQQQRGHWRGTQEVLDQRNLPMWAACGGAQGLAILAENGLEKPWDCPHCRDPLKPLLPIYTHIGHTGKRPCGDYSCCIFERGPHQVLQRAADPVFEGLPREFRTMESHCGQIEWAPKGWLLIAAKGAGGKTKTQCLRLKDRYIYAAQFHIEMAGTPESSRRIMSNFLTLAQRWGGYNPKGETVPMPRLHEKLVK